MCLWMAGAVVAACGEQVSSALYAFLCFGQSMHTECLPIWVSILCGLDWLAPRGGGAFSSCSPLLFVV